MRAHQFISEHKNGKLNKVAKNAMVAADKFKGETGRTYTLNRVMMAAAVSDGKSTKPVDINQTSWSGDYNTAHPFTDEEHKMMQSAYNTVSSTKKSIVKDRKSKEHPAVNTSSPVTGFKGYPR